jgi:pyruvate formate lyase activating enzyme
LLVGVPFVVRVPLVPGITDTNENLAGIAREISGMPHLLRVDLLPYNKAAGSKYRSAGMVFKPEYDESAELNIHGMPFERAGIKVAVA